MGYSPISMSDQSPGAETYRASVLPASVVAFFAIGLGAWLVSGGRRYSQEYADATQGWRVGTTRVVEITLVRQDKQNLACVWSQELAGLHCAGGADDARVLQPYNTIHDELLLGAGLWTSPELKGPLPPQRFTVVCDYRIQGYARSAAIRFNPRDRFAPLGASTTVGTLTNCVLPR